MKQSGAQQLNPQKIRLAFVVVSLSALLSVAVFWVPDGLGQVANAVLLLVPMLLSLIFGINYLLFVVRARTAPGRLATPSGLEASIHEPRPEELDTLVPLKGPNGISDFALWLFLRAILEPKGFYERISERVELGHVSLVRRVSYTCDLMAFRRYPSPSDPAVPLLEPVAVDDSMSSLVVPLARVRRGNLGDGLRVFDESGKSTSTVSSYDLAVFQLGVFRALVKRLPGLSLAKYIEDVEPLISQVVRRRTQLSAIERNVATDALSAFVGTKSGHLILMRLLETTLDWNPICLALSPERVQDLKWPETLRFSVESRSGSDIRNPVADDDEADGVLRKLDGLRLLLGVPINRIYASVSEADRTRSYHLEVCGPPGTYVARQAFLVVPSEMKDKLTLDAYVSPRRGQRRARTLITGIDRTDQALAARLVFAVKFFERAPGSFGITTIAAALLALATSLLLAAGLGGQVVSQTIAGVLLSLPAAAVALSGLDSRREFRQPSLLSMGLNASMLITVALSLFVVLVPLAQDTGIFLGRLTVVLGVTTFVVSASTWVTRMATERLLRSGVDELDEI